MNKRGALKVLWAASAIIVLFIGYADARKLDIDDPYVEPNGIQLFLSESFFDFLEEMIANELAKDCHDATWRPPHDAPANFNGVPYGIYEGSNPGACTNGSCLRTALSAGLFAVLTPGDGQWHVPDYADCIEVPVVSGVICYQLSVQDDIQCNNILWGGDLDPLTGGDRLDYVPPASDYNGQPCGDCEVVYYGSDLENYPYDADVRIEALNWIDAESKQLKNGLRVSIDLDNCGAHGRRTSDYPILGDAIPGNFHVCTGNPPPGDTSSYPCASDTDGLSAACYNSHAVRVGGLRIKIWQQEPMNILGLEWNLLDDVIGAVADQCPGHFKNYAPVGCDTATYCIDTYANVGWLDVEATIALITGDDPWTETVETSLEDWRHIMNLEVDALLDISGPGETPDHSLYIKIISPCPILGSQGYSWLNYDPCTELINPLILNATEGIINGALNNAVGNAIMDALGNMFPMDIAGVIASMMEGKECKICHEEADNTDDCKLVPYPHCDIDGAECYSRKIPSHQAEYLRCIADDIRGEGYSELNISKAAFQFGFYPEVFADYNDNNAFQINLTTGFRAKTVRNTDPDWFRCSTDINPVDGVPDKGSLLGKWDNSIKQCIYYSNVGVFALPEPESTSCVFAGNVGSVNEIDLLSSDVVSWYPVYNGIVPGPLDFRGQTDGGTNHSMGPWEGVKPYMIAFSMSQNIINRLIHSIVIGGGFCIDMQPTDPITGEDSPNKDSLLIDKWSNLVPVLQQVGKPNSYVEIHLVPRGDPNEKTRVRLDDPRIPFLGPGPDYDDRTPKVNIGANIINDFANCVDPNAFGYRCFDWPSDQLSVGSPADGYYDVSFFLPSFDLDLIARRRDGVKARIFTIEMDILGGIDLEMDLKDDANQNDNVFYVTMDMNPVVNNIINIAEACGTSYPNPCGDLLPTSGLSMSDLQGAIGGLVPILLDMEIAADLRFRGHTTAAGPCKDNPHGGPSDNLNCGSPFTLLGMGFDIFAIRPDEASYRITNPCPLCPDSTPCGACGAVGDNDNWTLEGCQWCSDADGDRRGNYCDLGPDCNDADNTKWLESDCNPLSPCADIDGDGRLGFQEGDTCADTDGDGRGYGCDLGADCDETNAGIWNNCSGTCTDADGDGHDEYNAGTCPTGDDYCDNTTGSNEYNWTGGGCTGCSDSDGDGRGLYCDLGSDCNDGNAAVWQGCSSCIDFDGDGHDKADGDPASSTYCPNGDDVCDDYTNAHEANWTAFGCGNCTDIDGDGYGVNCDLGADCLDTNPSVSYGCYSTCTDVDGDGHFYYNASASSRSYCPGGDDQCEWHVFNITCSASSGTFAAPDEILSNTNVRATVISFGGGVLLVNDPSGSLSGATLVTNQADGTSTCTVGSVAPTDVATNTRWLKNWTSTGCASCVDADGDFRGVDCDAGPDCNDADNGVFIGCAISCVDADGDQRAAATGGCPTGQDQCDGDTHNWTATGCSSCVDGDGDGRGLNCDKGPDCDDTNASIQIGCAIACIDADGDQHAALTGTCPSGDDLCDNTTAANEFNWTANGCSGGTACIDGDGDGRGLNCDYGADCNDSNAGVVIGCVQTCADADGDDHDDYNASTCPLGDDMCSGNAKCWSSTCCSSCSDPDNDKRGPNCDWGADCNQSNISIAWGCIYACVDQDGDRHDKYDNNPASSTYCPTGDDFCDTGGGIRAYNWTSNGCNNCVDGDGDWRGTNCDWGPDTHPADGTKFESPADGEICSNSDGDSRNLHSTVGANACLSGNDYCDAKYCAYTSLGCSRWTVVPDTDLDNDCRCGNAWNAADLCVDAGTDCAPNDASQFQLCRGTCTDADGDGHDAYNSSTCPWGDDLCDNFTGYNEYNWTANGCSGGTACVDTDNDKRGPNCDWGADCDNSNGGIWKGCLRTCTDGDSDGHDAYNATNCPTGDDYCDANPKCWSSTCCSSCVDVDGDKRGANCDLGIDCKDNDPTCVWGSCCGASTCVDADGDTREKYDASACTRGDDYCDDTVGAHEFNHTASGCASCVDADGDGWGAGCDKGTDCLDSNPACVWGACCPGAGGCVDGDGDNHEKYDASNCPNGDDYCDTDASCWHDWCCAGGTACVDTDGDSFGTNCENGPDCDDGDPTLWAGYLCGTSCVDTDLDGRAAVGNCNGGDDNCDNTTGSNEFNWTVAGCTGCSDGDGDGRGAGCDLGADCDDTDISCASGGCCPMAGCVDADGDGHMAYDSVNCNTGDDLCDNTDGSNEFNWTADGCAGAVCAVGTDYCDNFDNANEYNWSAEGCVIGCVDNDLDGYDDTCAASPPGGDITNCPTCTGIGCIDADQDGRGVNCDLGPDCDDTDPTIPDPSPCSASCADADGDGHLNFDPTNCASGDDFCDGTTAAWGNEETLAPHGTFLSTYVDLFGAIALGELIGPLLAGGLSPKHGDQYPDTFLLFEAVNPRGEVGTQAVKSIEFDAAESRARGFSYDNVTISWGGSDDYTAGDELLYTYRIDYGVWHAFTRETKVTLRGLFEGKHTFEVQTRNARGIHSKETAYMVFYIDSIAPTVYLQGDVSPVIGYEPHFYLEYYDYQTPSEDVMSAYRIDEGKWSEYSNYRDISLGDLKDGNHTLYIKARDYAGNEGTVAHSFRIDPSAGGSPSDLGCSAAATGAGNAGWLLFLIPMIAPAIRRRRR